MKHAQKIILVSEDVLDRLEQKQKQETTSLVANLMNTAQDMEGTLK